MFFINLGKKILRGFGYFLCAVLIILCIILIISAALFGSKNTVDVFGFNIFMVQTDGLSTAPKGSAVIVKKCSAYDLTEGNLALYMYGEENKSPELGYVKDIQVEDGSYYVTVTDGNTERRFPETELIGHADYSSKMLGSVIEFIQKPIGVLCIAVLPCIALIFFDVIRAIAARMPIPEVIPEVKNNDIHENTRSAANSRIGVTSEGKATYSRTGNTKQKDAANNVLFSYSGKQRKSDPVEQRPIIPLTDKHSDIKLPERPSSGYTSIIDLNDTPNIAKNAGAIRHDAPRTPNSVAAGIYEQNAKTEKPSREVGNKTAELPEIPKKKDTSDAFFAQTATVTTVNKSAAPADAPQIGRPLSEKGAGSKTDVITGRTAKTSGKRSTQILASKRVEDLISDDDDDRNRHRRSSGDGVFDDILAGSDNKK